MTEEDALDIAAKAAGFDSWKALFAETMPMSSARKSVDAHAATLIREAELIEQHEAFKQKTSDAMLVLQEWCSIDIRIHDDRDRCEEVILADGRSVTFADFIIPAADPLVEAMTAVEVAVNEKPTAWTKQEAADLLRSELAKHGLKLERLDQ